ncbi:MAG: OmpA family protein, partial [Betaproteobacteria bacterium]|nr:OmpA family protein [Betaproteobacteria bacterium]
EGHCDERGSREYNLGLGQRRADGVRKLLEAQGVPPAQTDAVSMGSEKPFNPAHTEAAWAQNRRTDIRYRGE